VNFWSWFIQVFKMTDEQIKGVAGKDAMQYLRFQGPCIYTAAMPILRT
jgi:hypothetical protein